MAKPFGGQNPRNLTPVKDPRTGKLLGYTDRAGRSYTPDGKATASLPSGYGAYLAGTDQKHRDAASLFQNVETPTQQKKRQETESSKNRTATAAATGRKAWVDGQYVTIQEQQDGTWVVTPNGKDPKKDGSTVTPPSAFSALDSALPEDAPFLMGYTTGAGPGGRQWNPSMSLQLRQPGRNILTVGGGVAWLAELSTKDPGAYAAMLQKLHDAGYLSKQALAQAAGHWSAAAGQAFAEAARDTAVVNTTAVGRETTLDAFLKSKAGAGAAAEAAGGRAAYTPVDRTYTDPAYIKAAAKSAAEDVLGRQLTSEEESKLTARFRSLEDKKFDTIDAAAGNGGAVVTDPQPAGQIDAFVTDPEHAQEGANYRAAEYGLALKRLFGLS